MPSRTAAASSSSISRVVRLAPDDDAAGLVLSCAMAAAVTSGLGESSAIGDGDTVERGVGESDGAGMTVTTAEGEGRDRLGVGDAGRRLGLGLSAGADRLGVGSGGMTPVGELDGCARGLLLGEGLGAVLGLPVDDAFGEGEGVGAADAAEPSATAGTSAAAATPTSSDRRTSGIR